MPSANIDRSIARGAGTAGGAQLEELIYEGYGPAGVAVMVQALTDNRNRTAADVKAAFSKHGGSLGGQGSVAYMFEQKGILYAKASANKDELSLAAIEAGAADIDDSGEQVIIYTAPNQLEAVKEAIGEEAIESSDVELIPNQTVGVEDEAKVRTIMRMMEALEDLDDVATVTANFDIAEDLLDKVG